MLRHNKYVIILAAFAIIGLSLGWGVGSMQAQAPVPVPAQAVAPPPPEPEETPLFTIDSRLVVVHASVADKNGKLVTNLPQSAFKVFENNVEQPLKLFRREDVPVSLGVLIDNSGSMREKRVKVAAAALDLIRNSNPQDEVFVVNFNDDAYLDQPFTNDAKKLEEALEKFDTRGGTAMRDAVRMSIDYVKEKGKKDKKVLVVITDGNDNTSTIGLEDLVKKSQQNEVLIYLIGILGEEDQREAKKARRAMRDLAAASGGMDYYPKDLEEVDRITPEVAHEIRNQYTLAYTPNNLALDGTYRKINVLVNAPGKPTVRTRNGYYASPGAK